jgi:Delta14-sterol reductase
MGLSSGSFYEDFVMGQELVPPFLGLTLNFFWLRPSMMMWLFINLSFLAKHYEITGGFSTGMILYQLFTNIYVIDYFFFEEFVTSTWDIIAEK